MVAPINPRFPLGQTLATPAALRAMMQAAQNPADLLRRHQSGDFGDVSHEDRDANERAIEKGERVLSAYVMDDGVRVWVITEWDRSVTTTLLPDEY